MSLFLLLVVAAFPGCASVDKTMASWMGHHQSELIARWGPPKKVLNDGQGGMIFLYPTLSCASGGTARTDVTGSSYGNASATYGSATGQKIYNPEPDASYKAYKVFWINPNGRIYRWSLNGL